MKSLKEYAGAIFGFDKTIEELTSWNTGLKNELHKAHYALDSLKADLATAQNQAQECKDAFEKVEEMYKALNNTLHEKQEEINALNAQLQSQKKLAGKIGNLSGENKKLKSALEDMDKRIKDLIQQLKRKEN